MSSVPRESPGPAAGETLVPRLQLNKVTERGTCIRQFAEAECQGDVEGKHLLMSAMGCRIIRRGALTHYLLTSNHPSPSPFATYHSCRDSGSAPAVNANADGSGCAAERESGG